MRWGDSLEFTAEAGTGDFIYVPPIVSHQEINASATEVLEFVLCRSDGQAAAVNQGIYSMEKPEQVLWVDPTHPTGAVCSQSSSFRGVRFRFSLHFSRKTLAPPPTEALNPEVLLQQIGGCLQFV